MSAHGDGTPLKLLVDTNVWLDYFLARNKRHQAVNLLVARAAESEHVALYVSALGLKDLAYLMESYLKASVRNEQRSVTPEVAAAARETAWACLRNVLEKALVAPTGQAEVLQAFAYRTVHDDFEDDLVLATAQRIGANYLVTHDKALASHALIPCLTAEKALELMA